MAFKRTTLPLVLGFLVSVVAQADDRAFDLKAQVDLYKQRYELSDVYEKLLDNHGEGFEELYGVRNLRVVLHGVYYRGGANNKFNRISPRENDNPLQDHALDNMCADGFSETVYLYDKNWDKVREKTTCNNLRNQPQVLNYRQITAFDVANELPLMTKIYEHIKGITPGPLYGHCWNGWHASGMMAAMALRQFCGWSATTAVNYWIQNTDGDSNYPAVKKRIKNFKPFPKLKITAAEQALICP